MSACIPLTLCCISIVFLVCFMVPEPKSSRDLGALLPEGNKEIKFSSSVRLLILVVLAQIFYGNDAL